MGGRGKREGYRTGGGKEEERGGERCREEAGSRGEISREWGGRAGRWPAVAAAGAATTAKPPPSSDAARGGRVGPAGGVGARRVRWSQKGPATAHDRLAQGVPVGWARPARGGWKPATLPRRRQGTRTARLVAATGCPSAAAPPPWAPTAHVKPGGLWPIRVAEREPRRSDATDADAEVGLRRGFPPSRNEDRPITRARDCEEGADRRLPRAPYHREGPVRKAAADIQ